MDASGAGVWVASRYPYASATIAMYKTYHITPCGNNLLFFTLKIYPALLSEQLVGSLSGICRRHTKIRKFESKVHKRNKYSLLLFPRQ